MICLITVFGCLETEYETPTAACVTECGGAYVFKNEETRTCAGSCDTKSYKLVYSEITKTQVPVCAPSCQNLARVSPILGAGDHYQCLTACTDDAPYQMFREGETLPLCVPRCPDEQRYLDNGQCVKACKSKLWINLNNHDQFHCQAACPTGYSRAVDDGVGLGQKVCLPDCAGVKPYVLGNLTCVAKCDHLLNYFAVNNTCVLRCPIDQRFAELQKDEGQYRCSASCASGFYESRDNAVQALMCVECDLTQSYFRRDSAGNVSKCLYACEPGEVSFERECLSKCPSGMLIYSASCVKTCPDEFVPDSTNTKCIARPPNNNTSWTWLYVICGVIGGITLACVIALIVLAVQKRSRAAASLLSEAEPVQ